MSSAVIKVRLPCRAHIANLPDFYEMVELMKADEYAGLHSLSRIAEILAYKACRTAIMIGDPLNQSQMEQVVRNLSGLQKPWVLRSLHIIKVIIYSRILDLCPWPSHGASAIYIVQVGRACSSLLCVLDERQHHGDVVLFPRK